MKLGEIAAAVGEGRLDGDPATEITGLHYDSRAAGPGTLFVCVPGSRSDGHDFAPAVVEAGAAALVVERPLGLGVPELVVPGARAAMASLAVAFFGDPTATLRVAGITGTNGKTTTAFMLREVLEAGGGSCGLLGTVKSVVGGAEREVERTTPEAIDLQRTFREMLDAGDVACAMEVSSHAVRLGRIEGTRFALAAFTNLTQDHLDFHADMEDYYAAKRGLFFPGEGLEPLGAPAVINIDDPAGARLAAELRAAGADVRGFSATGDAAAEVRAKDVTFDAAGAEFTANWPAGEMRVRIALPGHFNVENALTALTAGLALGIDADAVVQALARAERVPGRFEPVDEGQGFAVLVDYAHTPDSLENVLRAARRITPGRLISVFGCGGDRDRAKRPLMGAIAARHSDLTFVTSDNPRSEEPDAIIAEILGGIEGGDAAPGVEVEPDRRAAIARALAAAARDDDTVVIAGKGHEQGQEFEGGRKIPFDDRDVAREELIQLTGAAEPRA